MAQRVHPIGFRLGHNAFWDSVWYSKNTFSHLLHEDLELKRFFINIFKHSRILVNRVILKRVSNSIFVNVYIYANILPILYRWRTRVPKSSYSKALLKNKRMLRARKRKLTTLTKFVAQFSGVKNAYVSIVNLFYLNFKGRRFLGIQMGLLGRFRRFRFFSNMVYLVNVLIRVRSANLFAQGLRIELERLESRRKNRDVWRLVGFIKRLLELFKRDSVLGMRVYLKGRFNGRKRTRLVKIASGAMPYNTIKAKIDYACSKAVTKNGSYGIKVWVCYMHLKHENLLTKKN